MDEQKAEITLDASQELKAYCAREKQDLARWGSEIGSREAAQLAALSIREANSGAAMVQRPTVPAGREVSTPKPSRPAGHLRLVHGGKS